MCAHTEWYLLLLYSCLAVLQSRQYATSNTPAHTRRFASQILQHVYLAWGDETKEEDFWHWFDTFKRFTWRSEVINEENVELSVSIVKGSLQYDANMTAKHQTDQQQHLSYSPCSHTSAQAEEKELHEKVQARFRADKERFAGNLILKWLRRRMEYVSLHLCLCLAAVQH